MPELTSLENAPLPAAMDDEDDTDSLGTEIYYLVPRGEIVIGRLGLDEDGVGSEERKRIREGWRPLRQYGSFKIQPYHMDHPFEPLFQRGGAKDMPVKQVIEQGFHFNPPLLPVCGATVGASGHRGNRKALKHTERCWQGAQPAHFPQLEGVEIPGPFPCMFCEERGASGKPFPSERGLRQHESVMHPEEMGSHRLGQQLIQGLGGVPQAPAAQDLDTKGELLKLREQIEAMQEANGGGFVPARTPYVCGLCGEAQPNTFALNKHISTHKAEPVPA